MRPLAAISTQQAGGREHPGLNAAGALMVTISSMPTSDGGQATVWDLSQRVSVGSIGDDVSLVQYLMVRFAMVRVKADPAGVAAFGLAIGEVDGIWGPKTAAAMAWLERSNTGDPNAGGQGGFLADGAVDPFPAGVEFYNHGPLQLGYKMCGLQELYCAGISHLPSNAIPAQQFSDIVMGMPNDGLCPPSLANTLLQLQAQVPVAGSS